MGSSGHVGSVQRGSDELRPLGRSPDSDLRCWPLLLAVLLLGGTAFAAFAADIAADMSVTVAERCVRWRRDRCDTIGAPAAGHSGHVVCIDGFSMRPLAGVEADVDFGQLGDFKALVRSVLVERCSGAMLLLVGVTISLAE